ncbi:MAG: hypothetical protein BV456_06130, partial [Thermoplasmata archaeon M8B2D]
SRGLEDWIYSKNDINWFVDKEITIVPNEKDFTEDEKIIAKNIKKDFKWIARDKNERLYIYESKPFKDEARYKSYDNYIYFEIFDSLFQSIKWEDDEPTLIDDIWKEN